MTGSLLLWVLVGGDVERGRGEGAQGVSGVTDGQLHDRLLLLCVLVAGEEKRRGGEGGQGVSGVTHGELHDGLPFCWAC
jgi:hypothetical protein